MVINALARIGVEPMSMRWTQKAGCSCPCSPGFVLYGLRIEGYSFWITLPGIPTVDETLSPREVLI
jgi:hypothetical protein